MTISKERLNYPMEKFKFHSDAGHGWLEVPRAEINKLGIGKAITGYSYQNGNSVFLEEDCDLSLFVIAYCGFHDIPRGDFNNCVEEMDSVRDSFIRGYSPYRAPWVDSFG